ncbi:MAG: FAD:protein FMN transferase [Candidatus Aadella gelida]|nr:FAD:protein FMN transferase [Candidatus Aadella gelida]
MNGMRPKAALLAVIITLLSCTFFLKGCSFRKEEPVVVSEILMGTFVTVKAYDDRLPKSDIERIINKAINKAREMEKVFDVYDPTSELNIINLTGNAHVSNEMMNVLLAASKIGRLTRGKFDITVSPILKKNGFYDDMPEVLLSKIPEDTSGMGWKNIALDPGSGMVNLQNGAWLDLSGIAKGYIVDMMSEILAREDMDKFLVDAGGDMYCYTSDPKDAWTIGVRDPGTGGIILKLEVATQAVATSGDYENIVFEGLPETLSHIVDPDTGTVIRRQFHSVTVITSTCAAADAIATGMMTMTPEDAMMVADDAGDLDVIIINERQGVPEIKMSSGADRFIIKEEK